MKTSNLYPKPCTLYPFIALVCVLLVGCKRESASVSDLEIFIVSPQGAEIRREFSEAFSKWHETHFGKPVKLNFLDIASGGTGNVSQFLEKAFAYRDSAGCDIVWGGGTGAFNSYLSHNFLAKIPPQAAGEPDQIDAVPPDVFGSPLHGKDGLWIASALSNFGIVINKDRIQELTLPTPRAWADIADPRWLGHLSLTDPSKSGSVRTSYEFILQQYGWERGWGILTLLFANARAIREGGANPAEDVGSADAAAGIVIDLYGRVQVLRTGRELVGFVVPEGGNAPDCDPIALLKGAPHAELAARFIRFVVSENGQRLWTHRAGATAQGAPGAPRRSTLGRMAILPSLYEKESQWMFDATNPYATHDPLRIDGQLQTLRERFLGDLVKAALIDNHVALVRARRAILSRGDPQEDLEKLCALPTYILAEVAADQLHFREPQPLTSDAIRTVNQQFAPPKDDPRAPYAERMQTELKTHWRQSFAQRFKQLGG